MTDKNTATAADTTAEKSRETETVTLDEPILRGNQRITTIVLRKPKAGALRGVTLHDIANMDVTALQRLLPRISTPTLTEQDVANMELSDVLQLGVKVAGFLLTKAERQTGNSATE